MTALVAIDGGKAEAANPTLSELVAKHWQLPPPELAAAVWRALPNIAVDEIEAELRRQAEASERHADALEACRIKRWGPPDQVPAD
jgi:hypothetical protein